MVTAFFLMQETSNDCWKWRAFSGSMKSWILWPAICSELKSKYLSARSLISDTTNVSLSCASMMKRGIGILWHNSLCLYAFTFSAPAFILIPDIALQRAQFEIFKDRTLFTFINIEILFQIFKECHDILAFVRLANAGRQRQQAGFALHAVSGA